MKRLQHLLIGLTVAAFAAHAETFPLTGKVVDAAGQPVAGAVVERYEYNQNLSLASGEMRMRERATTDAEGAYHLTATARTAMTLLARKTGLAPGWCLISAAPGAEPRLTLVAPGVLAGLVVDEADRPVADAEVSVSVSYSETANTDGSRRFNLLSGRMARECFSARTSADGRFRITGFPTNATAELTVAAPGKVRSPSGRPEYYGPDHMPFRAGQEDIRLVLEPAGSIEGRIRAEAGGPPLPKAHLHLQPEGTGALGTMQREPVESEADGSFRIVDVPAGSYRVLAAIGTNALPDWVATAVPVTVEVGQAARGVEIAATRGGLLAVRALRAADRQPLAKVAVQAYGPGWPTTAESDSNGVALLRLPPGEYQVSASKEDWVSQQAGASVEDGQTNETEIELSPTPVIRGIVRRPDGQPAAGLAVQIVGFGGAGSPGGQDKTDAEGRFEFPWNVPRQSGMDWTHCLLLRDIERGLAVAEDIDEETDPLDLRLAPGLTLAGRAECDGQPVTNATAALIFWTGNAGMHLTGLNTATNTPGCFEIPALPPGRKYGLVVSAPGYGQKSLHNLEISADAGRQELEPVELKPATLPLAGQVLDASDKPVAGVSVRLQGDDQPSTWMTTDREGRFRFEKVCEGPAQLHASARNSYGSITAEGGETNVVLRLGESFAHQPDTITRQLKGVVTDPDGQPVSSARVSVVPAESLHSTKTGADGSFDFKWSLSPWMQQMDVGPHVLVLAPDRNLAALEEIPEDATNLTVQLTPAVALAGCVQNPDGQALTNAEAGLWLRLGRGNVTLEDKLARTDASGRFELKSLPRDAQYAVFAKAKGHGQTRREVDADTETNRVELGPFVLQVADRVIAGQVINEKDKPVSGMQISLSGQDQPDLSGTTDRQGRFRFQVCEGSVQLFAYSQSGQANATAEAGDTNVVLQLTPSQVAALPIIRTTSLKAKPLPDLTALGLPAEAVPPGKPVLLCLLDIEQRPSRHIARLLAKQHPALQQRGLTVLAAQAVVIATDAFKEWQDANPVPFPVGRVAEESDKTRWALDRESLPWLILTDAAGRVVAEGFALDELDAKLKPAGE